MDLFVILVLLLLVAFVAFLLLADRDLSHFLTEKLGKSLDELKGQVVWVTGASSGIGAACAIEAAKYGAKLVISARSEDLLNDVKAKCLAAGKSHGLVDEDVLVLPMDLTDLTKHQECFNKVNEHFGHLDIMLHNAGKSQKARWEFTDIQVDRDMFELNVFSVINLSRLIVPHFIARGGGSFAIVSSVAGKMGSPFAGTYTGSKHALQQVGQAMKSTDKRMPAERCAHLALVAIVNKLEEAWLCFFPILPILYCNQYMPTITKRVAGLIGPSTVKKIRESKGSEKKSN